MNGSTIVPLISAMAAKIAIMVSGFFIVPILYHGGSWSKFAKTRDPTEIPTIHTPCHNDRS